ncbi:MAG: hypothetical protein HFG82_03560 [Dorea sp.]|jgi:hypothetical protein|nr:hypothetical protein [Dorea sp.]
MVTGINGTFCTFECAAIHNKRCYFVDFDDSMLYSFGLLDGDLRAELPILGRKGTRLFSSMVIVDGIAYLFPFNADKMYRIDLEDKTTEAIDFSLPKEYEKSAFAKFFASYRYKNKIYALGAAWPVILEYNTVSGRVKVFSDLGKDLLKYTVDTEEDSFFCKGCIEENKLYVPYCKGNVLVEISLEDQTYVLHEITGTKDGFSCAFVENGNIWMTSRRGCRAYYSDCKFSDYKCYTIGACQDEGKGCRFIDIVKIDNKILAAGFMSSSSYEFVEEEDIFVEIKDKFFEGMMWTSVVGEGELLMSSMDSGKIILPGGKRRSLFRIKSHGRKEPGLMKENKLDTLEDYLKHLL